MVFPFQLYLLDSACYPEIPRGSQVWIVDALKTTRHLHQLYDMKVYTPYQFPLQQLDMLFTVLCQGSCDAMLDVAWDEAGTSVAAERWRLVTGHETGELVLWVPTLLEPMIKIGPQGSPVR